MFTFRFVSVLSILVAATWPLAGQLPSTKPAFTFAEEQRVYIVAVDSSSRNASMTKADLELERYAKNAFKRHRVFKVANTLHDADFVFFVMLDPDSRKLDELALVVSPSDYQANGNLDALRNVALWQSDNYFRNAGAEAALAGFTLGTSLIFHHADVVAGLVKQFHRDTIGK
jgi:hypothetical protein